MRNDLKAVEGVVKVETDVDKKHVMLQVASNASVESILNQVAESNNKLKEWELIEE